MLHICLGIYLVLGLPAILLIWAVVAAAKRYDMGGGYHRQRDYQISLTRTNRQNTQYGKK